MPLLPLLVQPILLLLLKLLAIEHSPWTVLKHLSLEPQLTLGAGTAISPILQMTDWRLGEVKQFAHCYTAAHWQDRGSEPRSLAPEPMPLTTTLHVQREMPSTVRQANQDLVTALLTCIVYTLVQFFLVGRRDMKKKRVNKCPFFPPTNKMRSEKLL